jgi:hypothetical protein
MKTDPMFNLKHKNKLSKEQKVTIGLLVTGLLSILLVLITVYGQFTGTFQIKVTHIAEKKGILLSLTDDFGNSTDKLTLDPIRDIEDIIEENIVRISEILVSEGGQYVDPDGNKNYIAYTFYLKNVGSEVVDIRYDLTVLAQRNNLADATTIIIYEHSQTGEDMQKRYYYKSEGTDHLGFHRIPDFKVGEIRKFTLIAFVDGHRSNPSMKGGAVKFNLVFTVETADEE